MTARTAGGSTHRSSHAATPPRVLASIAAIAMFAMVAASCGQAGTTAQPSEVEQTGSVPPTEPVQPTEPLERPDPVQPTEPDAQGEPAPAADAALDGQDEQRADPGGEPARVVIPAIDVDVSLVRLGLESDGAMEVPDFGLAGWYTEGPMPGHPGPAVIAAHVDSRAGPDVFYRLGELAPGDEVHVVYDGGDQATFVVDSSEQTPKDALPVDTIWPVTNDRLLTLITCGGDFDRSVRHYRDNIVVYTTPLNA